MVSKFRLFQFAPDFHSQWKLPFQLSLGFHLVLFVSTFMMPFFMSSAPRFPEIYTVNLFTVAEINKIDSATPQTTQQTTHSEKQETATSIVKQPVSTQFSQPIRAISIKPAKQKIRKAAQKAEQDFREAKQALIKERNQAERNLQKVKEEASLAAQEALEKLRQSLQVSSSDSSLKTFNEDITQKTNRTSPGGSVGTTSVASDAMNQYLAAVYQRIQSHWFLPPLQDWQENLEAVVVIKVRKNGKISKTFFEKKSDNIYFNQFLLKTVRESEPLPPFPDELDKRNLEIGLRFTPAGVY